jgi:hypothetical protein
MQRYSLSEERVSINRNLYSTENSIFDGKNNNIRRGERQESSLNKNSMTTPGNFKKLSMLQTGEEFKINKFTLPKTAATVTNKTEHFLPNSIKVIHEPLTQK